MAALSKLRVQIGADTAGFHRGVKGVQAGIAAFAARTKRAMSSAAADSRRFTASLAGVHRGLAKAGALMKNWTRFLIAGQLFRMAYSQVNTANASIMALGNTWKGMLRSIALSIEAFVAGVLPGFQAFAKSLGAAFTGSQGMAQSFGQVVGRFLQVLGTLIEKVLGLFGVSIPALPAPLSTTSGQTAVDKVSIPGQSISTAFGDMAISPLLSIQTGIKKQIALQLTQVELLRKLALRGAPLI